MALPQRRPRMTALPNGSVQRPAELPGTPTVKYPCRASARGLPHLTFTNQRAERAEVRDPNRHGFRSWAPSLLAVPPVALTVRSPNSYPPASATCSPRGASEGSQPGWVTADTGHKEGKPPCRWRDRHQGRQEEHVCRQGYHLLWPPPTCQRNGRTKLLLCMTARCPGQSVHSRCSA